MTNLQRIRLERGLSQSQYECKDRNNNKAQFETVCKLSSALSVKAEDLREIDE